MRVLVTGGSGLLGGKLVRVLAERGFEVVATYNRHQPFPLEGVRWVRLDVTDTLRLEDLILKERPGAVVHAAAFTDVDGCERDKAGAWRVNVEATRRVVRASRVVNAYLIYVSTDYVFDGEKGLYVEEDLPNPINYYGFTKLVGEELVKSSDLLYTVVRPSNIFGIGGGKKGFAEYVVERLSRGEGVSALTDQYLSPTYNGFLAEGIARLLEVRPMGVLHMAGERLSRYEFAVRIARRLGVDESLVKPVAMNGITGWVARRPRDSSLDCSRARRLLGWEHNTDKAISLLVSEARGGLHAAEGG